MKSQNAMSMLTDKYLSRNWRQDQTICHEDKLTPLGVSSHMLGLQMNSKDEATAGTTATFFKIHLNFATILINEFKYFEKHL